MESTSCPRCAAYLPPGAAWCGQCLHRLDEPAAESGAGRPSEALPSVGLPLLYSRRRGGVTSFGPVGRVVVTLLAIAPPLLMWQIGGMTLAPFAAVYCVLGLPLVLRDVWKRERVL